mmetsp:Transcript_9492/g.20778  ORF Transcript_9492/g.20778 Transcript_9492/m.20778 type:complete len:429 (-) Transcript_9492:1201-2487(-)
MRGQGRRRGGRAHDRWRRDARCRPPAPRAGGVLPRLLHARAPQEAPILRARGHVRPRGEGEAVRRRGQAPEARQDSLGEGAPCERRRAADVPQPDRGGVGDGRGRLRLGTRLRADLRACGDGCREAFGGAGSGRQVPAPARKRQRPEAQARGPLRAEGRGAAGGPRRRRRPGDRQRGRVPGARHRTASQAASGGGSPLHVRAPQGGGRLHPRRQHGPGEDPAGALPDLADPEPPGRAAHVPEGRRRLPLLAVRELGGRGSQVARMPAPRPDPGAGRQEPFGVRARAARLPRGRRAGGPEGPPARHLLRAAAPPCGPRGRRAGPPRLRRGAPPEVHLLHDHAAAERAEVPPEGPPHGHAPPEQPRRVLVLLHLRAAAAPAAARRLPARLQAAHRARAGRVRLGRGGGLRRRALGRARPPRRLDHPAPRP